MKNILVLHLLWLWALAFTVTAYAQNYSLDWHTIDGGGATSTGGVYAVTGTIGQADAGGPMANGSYAITGGFWSILSVIQSPGAPLLSVIQTNGIATIYWPLPADGWMLDSTPTLALSPATNLWTQVGFPYITNGSHIYITVPLPAINTFYRLRKP